MLQATDLHGLKSKSQVDPNPSLTVQKDVTCRTLDPDEPDPGQSFGRLEASSRSFATEDDVAAVLDVGGVAEVVDVGPDKKK